MPNPEQSITLVLSGGNALGAYQAGAYQALQEHGLTPDWVIGASIGAINGAVICGNPPDQQLDKLRRLWRVDDALEDPRGLWAHGEHARRTGAAVATMASGQPGLFTPSHLLGSFWNPLAMPEPSGAFDSRPLEATLSRLVDFSLLNRGQPRFSATAVDLQSGEEVVFDTTVEPLDPRHLRASSALAPVFPPVDVGGRLLGDGGIAANLPLDLALAEAGEGPLLCIALDLLPLQGDRPRTTGETLNRVQDLVFASQSRRTIAAWQAIFDARGMRDNAPAMTLLHITYADQQREVSGKAFDYSKQTATDRWKVGLNDVRSALRQLNADPSLCNRPGLTVFQLEPGARRELETVRFSLAPTAADQLR